MTCPTWHLSQFKKKTAQVLISLAVTGALSHAHAMGISQAKVSEFDDRTELTLEFDGKLPEKMSLFRITNPSRQVVDFPMVFDNAVFPAVFDKNSRIKSADLLSVQGRTRLVFEMAANYEVFKTETANAVKFVFKGPKPYNPGYLETAAAAGKSQLKADIQQRMGGKFLAIEGPSLQKWTSRKEEDGRERPAGSSC